MRVFGFIALTIVVSVFLQPAALLQAQCTCMGGAAVGGSVPGYGSGAMGVLPGGDLRLSLSYRYGFGDTYLRGSDAAETGPVLYYRMHYLDLTAAYGITEDLTVEAGAGAFPLKLQQFPDYDVRGNGVSHLVLGGRYLLANRESVGVEWTAGVNVRFPMARSTENLPQHLDPSTGAIGGSMHTRFAVELSEEKVFLLLLQNVAINGENESEYRYGPSWLSSLGGLWMAAEGMMIVAELRYDVRAQDDLYGEPVTDTGGSVLSLAPQVGIRMGSWTLSPFAEIPLYRRYNGHQLANDFSAGLNIIWQWTDHE